MKRRSLSLAVLLILSAGVARAQVGKGLNDHSHSASGGGANGGGSTLAPRRVSMIANSTFTALGNVAIGTTTPTAGKILTVLGNASISGGLTVGSFAATTAAFTGAISAPSVAATYGVTGATAVFTGAASAASFTTTAGANLATASGNVGIGTTSPAFKLDIKAPQGISSYPMNITGPFGSAGAGYAGVSIVSSDTAATQLSANVILYTDPVGANRFMQMYAYDGAAAVFRNVVFPYGSVGIGTTGPDSNLTVAGSAAGTINIWANGGGSWTDRYNLQVTAGDDLTVNQYVAGVNTQRVVVKNGGKVGIGTSAPSTTLDVAGPVRFDFLGHGTPTGNPLNTGSGIWATSIDGASQSSGCIVAVKFADGGGASDVPTFTSTTTSPIPVNAALMGILLESCAPGAVCRVGFGPSQPYRAQIDSGGGSTGDPGITFSSTRCRFATQITANDNLQGHKMQNGAIGANAFAWIRFR